VVWLNYILARSGFLTLASLILENTGLLKAGNQPTEFDPEKGGVVKFEDVLGCDEAKDVSDALRRYNLADR